MNTCFFQNIHAQFLFEGHPGQLNNNVKHVGFQILPDKFGILELKGETFFIRFLNKSTSQILHRARNDMLKKICNNFSIWNCYGITFVHHFIDTPSSLRTCHVFFSELKERTDLSSISSRHPPFSKTSWNKTNIFLQRLKASKHLMILLFI